MISNFNNTLKFLTLELKLCDSLPPNLCYLDLNLVVNPDDLVLFVNCDQIDLKRLLIRNRSSHNLDVTLNVIKDFIKNKNLDYFIRNDPKFRNNLEFLFKEIQSFVKIKNYSDLAIKLDNIGNIKFNY
ncbi:hypothetical protein RhiirA4_480789 [Rhizophagus irregularis]|uniref:Uncharacterized protein n=1 Tax=Rhizophagus irregularis TaxID=588596 RepID=A0A2I1HII0_9GLOM|nr:hypothetical protein RhiirA4_480789 [Rhizophagus irregularis]